MFLPKTDAYNFILWIIITTVSICEETEKKFTFKYYKLKFGLNSDKSEFNHKSLLSIIKHPIFLLLNPYVLY